MTASTPPPAPAPLPTSAQPPAPRLRPVPDPARVRAWLAALGAFLLVLLFVVVELTYSSTHLPPPRYRPVAPGGLGEGRGADFRLLSLRQTERWGTEAGEPGSPEPGAVWVVAQLEVTPRVEQDYLLCTMTLVATDERAWEPVSGGPSHEGESCAPKPEQVEIGTSYPFVLGFEVPVEEADHLAGLAVETYSWRASPLLRPPA